mmetsp:Transcript_14037/g.19183  ORF Transcript_14037/g.19183 Transcript_14037/m.19183 type:complete len:399 (-) Transcript_14037:208-1404(-)
MILELIMISLILFIISSVRCDLKTIHHMSNKKSIQDLRELALVSYPRLIPCLKMSPFFNKSTEILLSGANITDDIFQHYKLLLNITEASRFNITVHEYAGYHGPWIENLYIHHLIHKPLSYFHGMIPIFTPFVDLRVQLLIGNTSSYPKFDDVLNNLLRVMRDDLIYVIVSQEDDGIGAILHEMKPNVLVMSAGGYGHIPLPLIKGELRPLPTRNQPYSYDVSFAGDSKRLVVREKFFNRLHHELRRSEIKFFIGNKPLAEAVSSSKFNLAPRGWGRTSFRLYEIIQLGGLPIYVYDDHKWLPYLNTNISIENFGFAFAVGQERKLIENILAVNNSNLMDRMEKVAQSRHFYTYKGVIEELKKFFRDPLGDAGYLRCTELPLKSHRRRRLLEQQQQLD